MDDIHSLNLVLPCWSGRPPRLVIIEAIIRQGYQCLCLNSLQHQHNSVVMPLDTGVRKIQKQNLHRKKGNNILSCLANLGLKRQESNQPNNLGRVFLHITQATFCIILRGMRKQGNKRYLKKNRKCDSVKQ